MILSGILQFRILNGDNKGEKWEHERNLHILIVAQSGWRRKSLFVDAHSRVMSDQRRLDSIDLHRRCDHSGTARSWGDGFGIAGRTGSVGGRFSRSATNGCTRSWCGHWSWCCRIAIALCLGRGLLGSAFLGGWIRFPEKKAILELKRKSGSFLLLFLRFRTFAGILGSRSRWIGIVGRIANFFVLHQTIEKETEKKEQRA